MPVFDLYSKRQSKKRGEMPDVYTYDNIPEELRVQILLILKDAIGDFQEIYSTINDILCREYGLFELPHVNIFGTPSEKIHTYFLKQSDFEKVMDVIELSFKYIDKDIRNDIHYMSFVNLSPDNAIKELNERFLEHGVGYQFENGQIIRIDEKMLHSEVVKPALYVLSSNEIFMGASEEFLKAHSHYRKGNYQDSIQWALKSFESTMKAICEKNQWEYNQSDSAKKLIEICIRNEIIPSYLHSQFTSLRSVLESGVPTVRNKLAGHGRGTLEIFIPPYLCSYVLYMTANNILFLAKADQENKIS